jgi:hypothetical protein
MMDLAGRRITYSELESVQHPHFSLANDSEKKEGGREAESAIPKEQSMEPKRGENSAGEERCGVKCREY